VNTSKLIELLQKADPSGQTEVCVGNVAIVAVSGLPAYYDGPLQVIERNAEGRFSSAKFVRSGSKINIFTRSVASVISDYTNFPIDLSELSEGDRRAYTASIEKIRQANRDLEETMELENFIKWVRDRAIQFVPADTDQDDYLKDLASEFFQAHLSPTDLLSMDSKGSYVDCRKQQWDQEIEITFDGFDLHLTRKSKT
jgi:hypothetical protein